jgi:AraC family transcriptional regulator
MQRPHEPNPPVAPKQAFSSLTGMSCTFKTEGMWVNGLIHAGIAHYGGSDAETLICRQEHMLILTLSGGSEVAKVKIPGTPVYENRHRSGCVSYAPADVERQGWYKNVDLDCLVFLIDPGFIGTCEFGRDVLDIPPFVNSHDPLIQSVLWSLAHELRDGTAPPSIYAEHAAGLVMAHLTHSAGRDCARPADGAGLSDADLRRVIEFVEENLGHDISLTALAALTGTGVDVFARNFKASMGVPPYRYVLERRLKRAQALLMDGGKSIAEIAFEVGFSSQAHFTTQFSKAMHISPAAYRALYSQ